MTKNKNVLSFLPKRIPLRPLLIVPFVLQVSLAVGLTGYLALRNSHNAVNRLATQLRQEASERINQHLNSYLAVPRQVSELGGDSIESGLLNPLDLQSIDRFFWKQMHLHDVGYILFGTPTGEFAAAGHFFNDDRVIVHSLAPRLHQNKHDHLYETDDQGNRTQLAMLMKNYQFFKEAWYRETQNTRHPHWSSIYQWEAEPYPLCVAAAYPVYDAENRFTGVVAVEQRLTQISHFLQGLHISESGKAFIVERNGLLVATSDQEQPYRLVNGKPQRLRATDSKDTTIQETAKHLFERFNNFNSISDRQQFDFSIAGNRQFVEVMPWRDAWGLDWLVVVVMPEADFMAEINAYTQTTILLCLVALALATLSGLYTARWIIRPILQLNSASKAIAAGDFDQTVVTDRIEELAELAQSFTQMSQQLRDSFKTLEQMNQNLELRVQERTEELSQALRDLQQTQLQLIQTEKMSSLGQMVAGIAHELNNPVNFIHGNISYAIDYITDLLDVIRLYQTHYPQCNPTIQEKINEIDLDFMITDLSSLLNSMQEGTRRIQTIVLSLRTFSRLDEAEEKVVNIHEGIDSTLLLLQHQLKARHDRSEIKVIKDYRKLPSLECYPGLLNQVFMNILLNAIDAIEARWTSESNQEDPISSTARLADAEIETPQIHISSDVQDQHVVIRIHDNGIGMTEAVKSKLFDPFFTTKPVGQGTGLGLAISYKIIVEQHGGKLHYHSTVDSGTEFVIEIPLHHSNGLTRAA